jgi:hypothetical protein
MVANDSSGNGNTGALTNGPLWTLGKVGGALYFDGVDDSVTISNPNALDVSSAFTLSAWVNPSSTFTDFRAILVKNYKYYLYSSVAGYCGNGTPLGGFSEGTNKTICEPTPLPINTWTHLAVTYDETFLTLYKNGVAAATATVSGTLSPSTGTLQIGGSQFGENFQGFIVTSQAQKRCVTAPTERTFLRNSQAARVATTPYSEIRFPASVKAANTKIPLRNRLIFLWQTLAVFRWEQEIRSLP